MAEVVAAIASVIALVQLAERVLKLAKVCLDAIEDCPRDIRVILVEVSTLKALLENVQYLLENGSSSEILVKHLCGERGPISECRRLLTDLEVLLPSDAKSTSNNKRQKLQDVASRLAWPLKENKARKLLQDIANQKGTITLALTSDIARDVRETGLNVRQVKQILTDEQRHQICLWLEITNPSTSHNNAWKLHVKQTNLWAIQSPEWQQWTAGSVRFLWIHGIPGAGKTILASFLIEEATRITSQSQRGSSTDKLPTVCVYYYCSFQRNQDESIPFLRWLLGQLFRRAKCVTKEVEQIFQLQLQPTITQLLEALQSILELFSAVYVVIDAVDESLPRLDLLRVLRDLATDFRFEPIRLLTTSREYYDIETCFADISTGLPMNNSHVQEDIRLHVQAVLASDKKFQTWPKSLILEVEDGLVRGARGMFRWAVCQIDILHRLKSFATVRRTLSNLPKTLDETYIRIFELIDEDDRAYVKRALALIIGNNLARPVRLTSTLLLKAVLHPDKAGTTPDNNKSGTTDESHDENLCLYTVASLRNSCGCLVSFSSNGGIEYAALAHYTVQEFLFSDRIPQQTVTTTFPMHYSDIIQLLSSMVHEVVISRQGLPLFGSNDADADHPQDTTLHNSEEDRSEQRRQTYRHSLFCYCILLTSIGPTLLRVPECGVDGFALRSAFRYVPPTYELGVWYESTCSTVLRLERTAEVSTVYTNS